jgi:hypothetical protein
MRLGPLVKKLSHKLQPFICNSDRRFCANDRNLSIAVTHGGTATISVRVSNEDENTR